MLLVDHHQAEVAHRGEDRRARADADPRLARMQALPLVAALARRQPRMEQRHAVAEPRREPRDRLGRQPDLRHEHDRALPPLQRRLGGRQVDLGLARARDPVQQVLAAGAAVHRRDDRLDRRALLGRQRRPARRGADLHHPRAPQALLVAEPDEPPRLQAAQRRPVDPVVGLEPARRELGAVRRALARQPLERAALPRPQPGTVAKRPPAGRGGGGERLEPRPRPPARPAHGGRQHELQPTSRGRAVLAGHPDAEPDELGRRPRRQGLDRLGEPFGWQLARLGDVDHDSDHPPAAERHQQDAADADLAQPLRQAVVERPPQRPGGGQRLNLRDRHAQENLGAAADAAGSECSPPH